MTKRDWLKKSSLAVMLSTSLLMFAEGGQASAAQAIGSTVASEASELLGNPYKYAANGPQYFDSAGYVSYVLKQVGVNVNDTLAALNAGGTKVAFSDVQAGDVLLFKSGSSLSYAGIYIGNDQFLYASKAQGKVIKQALSKVKGNLGSVRRYVNNYIGNPGDSADDSFSNAQIVQLVRAQLGKDYQTNQNGPTQFDAAGLVAYVYGQMGLKVTDTVSALYSSGEQVSQSNLEPGDIVFFKNSTSTKPSYCGIYVGDGRFVYAAQGEDKVVEKKLSYFQKSFVGARRLHEVETTQPAPNPGEVTPPVSTDPQPTPQPAPTPVPDNLGAKLIQTGEKYLGVPYKFGADWADYQGKYFDCSGFTQRVFAENGIKLSRGARAQSGNGVEVARKDLQVGDLVFFSTGATMKYDKDSVKRIGHVGIYAGDNKVLHTYGAGGVRYSTMSKGWWDDHYVRAVRVTK